MTISFTALAQPVQVVVTGVSEAQTQNILARLSINHISTDAPIRARRIQRLHSDAPEEIQEAMQAFGYYHASVTSELYQGPEGQWRAVYHVERGPSITVTAVHIEVIGEGSALRIFSSDRYPFPIRNGQRFCQQRYEQYKKDMYNRAQANGFFDGHFAQQAVYINTDTNTAEIHLLFNTGRRYYFGDIEFLQDTYADKFLMRYVDFAPGDPFISEQVVALQSTLSQSGYFETVNAQTPRDETVDYHIPVDITTTPVKRFAYSLSGGYGTDTGLRAGAGWHWRRVNALGHRFNTEVNVAEYRQSVGTRYQIPGKRPAHDYYEIYTAYVNDMPQARDLDSETFEVGASHVKGDVLKEWQRVISLGYQRDYYRDSDGEQRTDLLLPRYGLERINTDNRFDPTRGYRLYAEVRGASEALASSTNFIQVYGSAKGVYAFAEKQKFIVRSKAGISWEECLEDIPPNLRFYAGGDNSVRGYAYQSIGDKGFNDKGEEQVIGGSKLFTGSIEHQWRFYKNFSTALFIDGGNASEKITSLKYGAGPGLRWQSPVGPVRLDVAKALSEDGDIWRIHFSMGPEL